MPGRRLVLAGLLAACVGAGGGESAVAATVDVRGGVLTLLADIGEPNDITIVALGTDLLVGDAGAALRPGPGCRPSGVEGREVACARAEIGAVAMTLADGDDRVQVGVALAGAIDAGDGDDELRAGAATTLIGGPGADVMVGSPQDDTFVGGSGSDLMVGGAGNDTVRYDDGLHDRGVAVSLAAGADDGAYAEGDDVRDIERVVGGAGPDGVRGTDAAESFAGGPGADVADLGAGDDVFDGGPGDDLCRLDGLGRDVCDGGPGEHDVVTYRGALAMRISLDGVANDGVPGARGNVLGTEEVVGGEGDDVIVGSTGDDALLGRGGDDLLQGGEGDDVLSGDRGADVLSGGAGRDRVTYASVYVAGPVRVALDDGAGDGEPGEDDRVGRDVEIVEGSLTGADRLAAGRAPVEVRGLDGADLLIGGPGADRLLGGDGPDRISALDGRRDTVVCGRGADRVVADPSDVLVGCEREGRERVALEVPRRLVAGRRARFVVGCPASYRSPGARHRARCDGTLTVRGSMSSGRRFRVPSAARRGVEVRLPRGARGLRVSVRLDGIRRPVRSRTVRSRVR